MKTLLGLTPWGLMIRMITLFHNFFYSFLGAHEFNLSYQISRYKSDQLFFPNFQDLWKPYLDWYHGLWRSGYWWQWNIPRYVAISSPTEFGPNFLCWISGVVQFTTWLISSWEENKCCYMVSKCRKWHHLKWYKLPFSFY